ncbi:Mannitol dehydrogenase domain protein [Fibrisoma limi BUZ 3]|uniref:Mannitol dehydrogenase domain protein n=1 Tax=Fibrisoma limi BUZ 3 TaxID=1185876 RepID=I2GJG8_9BACT|nr:tagaturonate reductase [Fibrisoma limi]CCH54043.1 Mannitol dehydrogenase domain protein [Fibrisoma limi BUZ 3]
MTPADQPSQTASTPTMAQLNRTTHPAPEYPEKILQFGTGVLLRGLPDYLVQKANAEGRFNGSIVVVKSTDSQTDEFAKQDNLYTVVVRGIQQGQEVAENTIVSAVSRVLAAQTQWQQILTIARNPNLQIVISNTTEVGLDYVEESIFQHPPQSFPGKLTAFLYERFRSVGGAKGKGLVVIPTELVTDNGLKLRGAVEKLAQFNELGKLFTKWLKFHVRFCNSLVDRIVTRPADAEAQQKLQQALGYEDDLLTLTEPYHLWAIEGDERVKETLTFVDPASSAIIIDEDILFYRERKLRVLNGTHTFATPMGYLLGLETVADEMQHPTMSRFVERLMLEEIVPTVPAYETPGMDKAAIKQFAYDVLDRFRNPHLDHLLLNISLQQSAKMQARNVATLQRYYEQFKAAPTFMTLGFAAYLLFMKAVREEDGRYVGEIATGGGVITYPIRDEKAKYFYDRWQQVTPTDAATVRQLVVSVCADDELWGIDLSLLPDFVDRVTEQLTSLLTEGIEPTLAKAVQ